MAPTSKSFDVRQESIIEEHVLEAINLDGIQTNSGREIKIFTAILIVVVITFGICLVIMAYFL